MPIQHLNVALQPSTISAAKHAASQSGMLLRSWVDRAILEAADRQKLAPIKSLSCELTYTYDPAE